MGLLRLVLVESHLALSGSPMRSCGHCTACCKPMPILETGKPIGVWCEHCDKGVGCRIYAHRPTPCREFVCQWLMGIGEENDRPDKTKVILDFVCRENEPPGGILQIWEVSEGALGKNFVREVTNQVLLDRKWISHIPLRGRKKLFPPRGAMITTDMAAAIREEDFEVICFSTEQ